MTNYNNPYMQIGTQQFNPYMIPQAQPQQPQQSGSILMIQIQSDDEVNTYPVAAGTTVMLINFSTKKFWLKSTNTSGVPEPIRSFNFNEEVAVPQVPSNLVTRDEFDALNSKLDKLLKDLGGDK